jgi:hypothetical protein
MLPWPTLVFVYGIEIALVSYFMLPAVRATYFNPRVRWWESKPRYELKLPAHLKVGVESLDAQVVNVSEGGVFIRTGRNLPLGDSVGLRFEILGQAFEVDGRIVHVRKAVDSGAGVDAFWHGMEFAHTFDTSRRFQGLSKALRELGFQDRTPREPLFVSFKDWTSNLLRTGKGLTPDLGTRPKG